ncbi:MAG TPA: hypothetical protein VF129_06740 [Actinomycetota bacterium]
MPKPRRGWISLYAAAFVLMLISAVVFVVASLGRLESVSLLRVSAWISGAAIVLAVASVLAPRRG